MAHRKRRAWAANARYKVRSRKCLAAELSSSPLPVFLSPPLLLLAGRPPFLLLGWSSIHRPLNGIEAQCLSMVHLGPKDRGKGETRGRGVERHVHDPVAAVANHQLYDRLAARGIVDILAL